MRLTSLALGALLLLSAPLAAQEQTGALEGNVVDSSGAVLPGVTVTITGPTIIGGSRFTATAETGAYRLTNIPLGTYTVTFELAGFATQVFEGVHLNSVDMTVGNGFNLFLHAPVSAAADVFTLTNVNMALIDERQQNFSVFCLAVSRDFSAFGVNGCDRTEIVPWTNMKWAAWSQRVASTHEGSSACFPSDF